MHFGIKQTLRLITTFCVLASLSGAHEGLAAAASDAHFTDIAQLKCEASVVALSRYGVITGYEDGTFRPNQPVTRAEMAKLLTSIIIANDYLPDDVDIFTDSKSHWAAQHVAYATKQGLILGFPDKTFRPDSVVSANEAVTMTVRALGYTDQDLSGKWPTNFINKAKALKVAYSGSANRGEIAIMLASALDIPIDGDSQDTFRIRLEARHNVVTPNGFVTGDCSLNTYVGPQTPKITVTSEYGGDTIFRSFKDCDWLEEVVVGNGIAWIAAESFMNCTSLKKVTLGKDVEGIIDTAFENCPSLITVIIENPDLELPESVFANTNATIEYAHS